MSHLYKTTLCLLMTISFSTLIFAADDEGVAKKKIYHLANQVDLISTEKIQYDKPRIVIKAVYPELVTPNQDENVVEFNNLVNEVIESSITNFKQMATTDKVDTKNLPKSARKNDLYIDFAASYFMSGKEPILSVRFNIQGHMAGQAHPYHQHYTLNYDLKEGEELKLSDLFNDDANYLQVISTYARDVLNKKQLSSKDLIMQGTEPTADNFKHWNLKPSGLLFTFDEYQVAPYIDGSLTVFVPYTALTGMLSDDSPVQSCIKHKTRCLGSNILTGGFIDET